MQGSLVLRQVPTSAQVSEDEVKWTTIAQTIAPTIAQCLTTGSSHAIVGHAPMLIAHKGLELLFESLRILARNEHRDRRQISAHCFVALHFFVAQPERPPPMLRRCLLDIA